MADLGRRRERAGASAGGGRRDPRPLIYGDTFGCKSLGGPLGPLWRTLNIYLLIILGTSAILLLRGGTTPSVATN